MLDEYILGRRGPALHAVEHDGVGARFDRERNVVIAAALRRP